MNTTQLEESEETRRLKHKTLPRHARQIAHLQFRSRSGKTVDHAHRPQAGRHEGEDRRGKDHLFLSNATDPQHVKTVLNRLESGAAFSAMSGNRVEARLVGACAAFRPTDRTWLNELRAVNYSVCDTPKASNVNAERIERASQKVEKRSRTSRARFEGVSVERVCKVMPDTVRNCAWQITRRLRQCKAEQGVASTQRGALARVRRYRPVWRCPENQRWDRKPLTDMNGELRNITAARGEATYQRRGVHCLGASDQVWRTPFGSFFFLHLFNFFKTFSHF